jgi:hypothetical protein
MNITRIIILTLMLINWAEGQQDVGTGASGYSCPVDATSLVKADARNVGNALFYNVPIANGSVNFCSVEAQKAIQANMCNYCSGQKEMYTKAGVIGSLLSQIGSMGSGQTTSAGSPISSCSSLVSQFSQQDCGATPFVLIQCYTTNILNRILVMANNFVNVFNNYVTAEQTYLANLKTYYASKKASLSDDLYEPVKTWIINTSAQNYSPDYKNLTGSNCLGSATDSSNRSKSAIQFCDYIKTLKSNWPHVFAKYIGCSTREERKSKYCKNWDNPKKFIYKNIYDIIIADYEASAFNTVFAKAPLYFNAWNTLSTLFAQNDPSAQNLVNSIKALSCFFLNSQDPNFATNCPGITSPLSGADQINALLTMLFNPSVDPDSRANLPPLNKDVLQQVLESKLGQSYLNTLKKILGTKNNLQLPIADYNLKASTLFGYQIGAGSFVTNFLDLSNIIIELFASNSPLVNMLNLYVQQYLTYANACVVGGSQINLIEGGKQVEELVVFELTPKVYDIINKYIKNKNLKLEKEQRAAEREANLKSAQGEGGGDAPATGQSPTSQPTTSGPNAPETGAPTSPTSPTGPATSPNVTKSPAGNETQTPNGEPDLSPTSETVDVPSIGDMSVNTGAAAGEAGGAAAGEAGGAAAEVEGAAEEGGGAAGAMMMAYMAATSICSKLKPNEKWCDPIGELINLDVQTCGSQIGDISRPTVELLRPDCMAIYTCEVVYKALTELPKGIGYYVEGLCYEFTGGAIGDGCSGVADKVAVGLTDAVDFVGSLFSTSMSIATDFFTGGIQSDGTKKEIRWPWETGGGQYFGSGSAESKAEAGTLLGVLVLISVFNPAFGEVLAVFDFIRRIVNMTQHKSACGTTGATDPNPNSSCYWRGKHACCEADGPAHNDNCSGVYQNGGLLSAC